MTTALRLIRRGEGPSVGGRRITVSTAGYLPGIRRLAEDDLKRRPGDLPERPPPTRSESGSCRSTAGGPIADLLAAARHYFDRQGRRVTFEYVLLRGVTDTGADAERLARLTAEVPCKINLIPYTSCLPAAPASRSSTGRGGSASGPSAAGWSR